MALRSKHADTPEEQQKRLNVQSSLVLSIILIKIQNKIPKYMVLIPKLLIYLKNTLKTHVMTGVITYVLPTIAHDSMDTNLPPCNNSGKGES